jgi:6-hydroxycyclohex-1-ene-1-carbonyl-CoA dehydrogenase
MRVQAWVVRKPGEPMALEEREERPGPGEVLVEVAGCGVCHTDLGYYYGGVPTRHAFPLALGHEVSGAVVEAGPGAEGWLGQGVVVPAVIPCGACDACRAGRGAVCPRQVFPGNDVHGGFGTHVRVPAQGLCPVGDLADAGRNPTGLALADLSVVADAVSTPYQAVVRSGLGEGDLAVFVGVGGVGGFGVQVAAARGAHVVAVDVSEERLALAAAHGAALVLTAGDVKDLRKRVRSFAEARGVSAYRQRVFETSGTPAGQETAFALLGPGGYLSVVGFTPSAVTVRLSNLMAFDATVQGSWGCLPEHYPGALDLVLSGRVALGPFLERRPMSSINETFADLHARRATRRVVLIPEA